MGSEFNDTDNPLSAIILNTQYISGESFKNNEDLLDMVHNECVYHVMENIRNKSEIEYFDYTLKFDKFGDKIEIVPHNILTALWFVNIYPKNGMDVMEKNIYTSMNGIYKFDRRRNTLKLI